jgi:hypothetical protein
VPVPAVWAQVRIRDQTMRYRRRGAGRPVVLLDDGADTGWPALGGPLDGAPGDLLAAHFRTIRPELPAAAPLALATWLRDFLDGIGVDAPALVALGCHARVALALARTDADRVARVLVVTEGAAADGGADHGPGVPVAVPVLVVGGRDTTVVGAALAFLADDHPRDAAPRS